MPLQPPEPRFYWAHVREGYRITMPAVVRRHFELEPGDDMEFVSCDGSVEVRKVDAKHPRLYRCEPIVCEWRHRG